MTMHLKENSLQQKQRMQLVTNNKSPFAPFQFSQILKMLQMSDLILIYGLLRICLHFLTKFSYLIGDVLQVGKMDIQNKHFIKLKLLEGQTNWHLDTTSKVKHINDCVLSYATWFMKLIPYHNSYVIPLHSSVWGKKGGFSLFFLHPILIQYCIGKQKLEEKHLIHIFHRWSLLQSFTA